VLHLCCCYRLSLAVASKNYTLAWCAGFSLPWLLLLWRMGSRAWVSVVVGLGLSCSITCEIFLDQRSHPGPLYRQADSYPLVHLDSLTLCVVLLLFLLPLAPRVLFSHVFCKFGLWSQLTRALYVGITTSHRREKAMAPHSSTLAWKIPWMEEPGRLQSMGSLRVRHNWVTSLSLSTFMRWRRKWQPTPVFLLGESRGWRSLVGCSPWGRRQSDTTEAT